MHTAKWIRNQLFSNPCNFNGSLADHEKAVPPALLTFVTMLLEGPDNVDSIANEAAVSMAQLIMFNAIKRRRNVDANVGLHQRAEVVRHTTGKETPLPVYLGLMLHSATRKKKHIDKCYKLGLSISYDRVMQITNKTANAVCSKYRADNLVCPPTLQCGLFTVAAADNIDHNLSSATAQSSFHGTAVSLMQIASSELNNTKSVSTYSLQDASDAASDIILPSSYTDINPCIMPTASPIVPLKPVTLCDYEYVTNDEYAWLETVKGCIDGSSTSDNISWAAFHAEQDNREHTGSVVSALLPLFKHSANTAAMMKHSMIIVQRAINKVNPGQTPVITVDQPLYALMKQIQWHWPNNFGEEKFAIVLGGLHTEMAALRMLGHWLNGSGWIQCLVQAGVATSGVAESFLSASHVKRTRYAHTVTAAALYCNLHSNYSSYCNEHQSDDQSVKSFGEWRADAEKSSAQFQYWSTVLELELLVLSFVRSVREGNFNLYVDCLQKLAPWFFVCDQTNYARWLPVHIRDMLALEQSHKEVFDQFVAGNFTISKSHRRFSSIAIDQAHEQLNAIIKGDGGAVGLTENDSALSRWTITGPEIVRILQEFESGFFEKSNEVRHHEQTASIQTKFRRDVEQLLEVFDTEVPFSLTTADDLIVLTTNTVADKKVSETVRKAREIGSVQFNTFFDERLKTSGSVSVLLPLARNKLPLFQFKSNSKKQTASSLRVSELKTDCELFSRLYIACQTRDGNLDEFFCHENQSYPPSLSQGGNLRTGTKSDLLKCFTSYYSTHDITDLNVGCYVLDGAVIVQMLRPNCNSTFGDYKHKIFVPYVLSVLRNVQRVDVVFDVYYKQSLKLLTREKRGVGTRMIVTAKTKIPANWQEFLRVDDNKTELFHFLADGDLTEWTIQGKSVVMTFDSDVRIFSQTVDVDDITPCSHEEADTRIILHCFHAANCGIDKVAIRTVDTDIVVLAVAFFSLLTLSELWIHFGVGKDVRLIPIHELCLALDPSKCAALPSFHALTGCDTVSCLFGKGKKSAWSTWDSYPQLTQALLDLNKIDKEIDKNTFAVLERFVVLLYDRTSDCTDLNTARKQLFTKKSRTLETLPPTSNAFLQHVNRVVYQSVHCWSHSLEKQLPVHDPATWGWLNDDGKWVPLWMTIPELAVMCQILVQCSCKKACTARCKCVKANLPCTALCHCDGECAKS